MNIFRAISTLFFIGVAYSQNIDRLCDIQVVEKAYSLVKKPDKSFYLPAPAYGTCYSRNSTIQQAQKIACNSDVELISLTKIEEPNFLNAPCYKAKINFYASIEGVQIPEQPKKDSIRATGLQLLGKYYTGILVGGNQNKHGVFAKSGNPTSVSKTGLGLILRYYPFSFLGVELQTTFLLSQITSSGLSPILYTSEWSNNLGISVLPWQKLWANGRIQAVISSGLDYTQLSLNDSYSSFVESQAEFKLVQGSAVGLGWYADLGGRFLHSKGFLVEASLRFLQQNPKFKKELQATDGYTLLMTLGAGYRF